MTTLHSEATCTWTDRDHPTGCGWTTTGPDSYRAADKHTRSTGHGTTFRARPINTPRHRAPEETR